MPVAGEELLERLIGLPRNPKAHDIGELDSSIKRFGFLERVIINDITGHMIAGHGRIEDLRQMKVRGERRPAGIGGTDGSWLVPVDHVSIKEEEEEAAAIALNKLVERGGWDMPDLAKVLSDLAAQGEQMLEGIGFDVDDVDQLIKSLDDGKEKEGEKRDKPETRIIPEEAQAKWNVQVGDLWQVGEHRLLCGDCKDLNSWKRLALPGINGIFTSPPYAMQRKEHYGGVSQAEYVEWWMDVQNNSRSFLAEDGSFFINIKPHSEEGERVTYVMDLVLAMKRTWDWAFIDEFCWERVYSPGSWPNRFKNGFEPVYHFANSPHIKFRPDNVLMGQSGEFTNYSGNVNTGSYYNTDNTHFEWDQALPSNRLPIKAATEGIGHPAAFPPALPEFFIKAFSDDGDTWIDPFAGSGTLIVAAANTNRIGLGIEILPKYTAVALERLGNMGFQPKKLE